MERLAYFCTWAGSGDPKGAAQALFAEAPSEALATLINAAHWRDEDVKDFESGTRAVLISGRWGRFWLAPASMRKALLPPAPRVTPKGLVALARSLVTLLASVEEQHGRA